MNEFQNKNDYSISAFSADGFLCKHAYVGNCFKYTIFLNEKFPEWTSINVYARRSGRFIGQFKKGNYIPQKPR